MADDQSEKAPDAYRTISEVADDLKLPQHVLRFWETRFSQIKPLKRGGGRRYYRPDDVALIIGIRALLYNQGFTIKGVQKILRESGVRHVQAAGRGEVLPKEEPRQKDVAAMPAAIPEKAGPAEELALSPEIMPAAVAPPATLSATARMALRNALIELAECQRILDVARRAA